MTEQEAIELLRFAYPKERTKPITEECISMAVNALEKQIPKKPTPIDYMRYKDCLVNYEYLKGSYWCPNCNHDIRSGAYCNWCGQRIEWDCE